MDLSEEDPSGDGENVGLVRRSFATVLPVSDNQILTHFPGMARQKAYFFDGLGNCLNKDWDLAEAEGKEFCCSKTFSRSLVVSNGPFCGHVDGALVFRVNSPGPASSSFTFRMAARITENSVITVSLGRAPRLGFSQADNPVPKSISNLVVHIIDTHVNHLQDVVKKLEMELNAVVIELDGGHIDLEFRFNGSAINPYLLVSVSLRISGDCTRGASISPSQGKMFIQTMVFKSRHQLPRSDDRTVEEAERERWVSGEPLFGMNVGGVPWTMQNEPDVKDSFLNVMILSVAMLLLVLLCFLFSALCTRVMAWYKKRALRRSLSHNRTSSLWRNVGIQERGCCLRI
ncbi:hypothetical protein F3Y22_tig00008289pilonHSYRG00049 [Hibiscus syriacus]|uniref:Uncharacterized protein n=1 Tax=Hibiscus syriacus TaxID=106335 RepID=A0A6A3CEJ4_HIBSY|nr:hypothetical protein F3Y22_tig00008289pilonHSYRG00049 [Hibiscus syriacus]